MMYITKILHDSLIAYARLSYPFECCGYFLGKVHAKNDNVVEKFIVIKNIHNNPKHFFTFSPQDQLKTLKKSLKQNLAIIGIFHSHPISKAYPSKEDLKYFCNPAQSYCIVSLMNNKPCVASFRIDKNSICEERVKIL